MKFTRREVTAAGLALGAGCLSGGSNVRYPESASGKPLVGQRATAAATDDAGPAPSNPGFAPDTRGIHDETRWFASEYEAVLRAYLDAVEAARATVARVERRSEIDDDAIGVAERAVDDLLETIGDRVLPHFQIRGYIADETGRHLEVARTFARRGDVDRVREELGRLAAFLADVGLRTFVNRNMSRNPVRNRLLSYLRRSDDGSHGALFEVWDERTGFTTYAYGGPSRIRAEDPDGPFGERERSAYASRFVPAMSDDRRGATYVLARALPRREDQPDPLVPATYPENAVVVQAFDDDDAAAAARRALVADGPVTVEGRTRLGEATMDRIYYRALGDVVYAFMFRTAEFLVAVSPSEVAWNERINWSDGLQRTWLWAGG
ncbi:MAG: hypothetical protein ABEJ81_03765 [Haloferacaceae archaeon]